MRLITQVSFNFSLCKLELMFVKKLFDFSSDIIGVCIPVLKVVCLQSIVQIFLSRTFLPYSA